MDHSCYIFFHEPGRLNDFPKACKAANLLNPITGLWLVFLRGNADTILFKNTWIKPHQMKNLNIWAKITVRKCLGQNKNLKKKN